MLPPHIGGIETALTTLFAELPEFQFTVLTAQPPSDALANLGPNVRIVHIPLEAFADVVVRRLLPRKHAGIRHVITFPIHEWARRSAASRLAPEIVHMHSYAMFRRYAGMATRHPDWPLGVFLDWLRDFGQYPEPFLFTDHSLFAGPPELFHRVRNGLLLERLREVVCVERSGLENVERFAREAGLPIRARWIPNPVDVALFRPAPLPSSDRVVIGYAARYEKEGFHEVLTLMEHAPDWVEFRLALAGSPEERVSAAAILQGAPAHVEWNVPNAQMARFYHSIHLLVDPFAFGAPRTACESLACGRIVVRLRRDRVSEDLPSSLSPVADANDPASFYQLLERLRRTPQLERMGLAARDYAEETYSAKRVAEKYRAVYAEVARPSEV